MNKPSLIALSLCMGMGIATFVPPIIVGEQANAAPQNVNNYDPSLSLAPLVKQMSPAVVNIEIEHELTSTNGAQLPFFFGFETPNDGRIKTGQGTGFFISSDGYLLTNNHVVEGADGVTVKMANGESYEGKVIGIDDSTDVALVKIEPKSEVPYVELGSSQILDVGDWVVAIGNPFGLSHTVTAGIVSAKGRVIGAGPYDDFIQTDASINPGNSGGPLFNLAGEVVGINTAINPRAQGIGFSVPIDSIKEVLSDLKTKGHASRGWLGIALRSIEIEQLDRLKIDGGAIVAEVYTDTPAEKSGMVPGDIITHFNGVAVSDQDTLVRMVGKQHAGKEVHFKVLRNKKKMEFSVVLGERPSEKELAEGSFQEEGYGHTKTLGIRVATVSGFNPKHPKEAGLVIVGIDKRGRAKGYLRPGDVLVKVNDLAVSNLTELRGALQAETTEDNTIVFRNGQRKNIAIPR